MPVSDKDSRQNLMKEIINKGQVSTQSELVEMLAARGKQVTQATVSRDLKEIGVYWDRNSAGKSVYALPQTPSQSEEKVLAEQLQKVLAECTDRVMVSGSLVIIKTLPGSADIVASALDRYSQPEILATIAGDDTVFVAVSTNERPDKRAQSVARELEKLAGLLG